MICQLQTTVYLVLLKLVEDLIKGHITSGEICEPDYHGKKTLKTCFVNINAWVSSDRSSLVVGEVDL